MNDFTFFFKKYFIPLILAFGFIFLSNLHSQEIIPNKIPLLVEPFELSDVNLLDSPFKTAMKLDAEYLLQVEPDRLLSNFRKESGLVPNGESYGGWEKETLAGHSLGHYLSACAMMYASTGDYRFKERVDYIVDELDKCQMANGDGFLAAFPNGKKVFKEIASGDIRPKPFDLNGIWSPWYTLHKEFAGLLDAHHYCNNSKALDVAVKFADWAVKITSNLTEEQFQLMLSCEHGGMNEVLSELYARTGNENYLKLSHRFHHKFVLDPLANKEDNLQGLHANTQIPKIIGLARIYELTGDLQDKTAAEYFWDRVVHHHSYVIGGNSENEYFGAPDSLNDRLNYNTCETCNTYNMLKLTKHLFTWNPTAEYGDYYERALYNHILASQNPDSGMFCYYVTLKPGAYKTYSDRFNSFWCCVGSGMENHSKYGESIYFHNESELWVNLYIASELNWSQKGIILKQENNYPESGEMKFTFKCKNPAELSLYFRYPLWSNNGMEIFVNGKSQDIEAGKNPGSFVSVNRIWKNEDIITVKIPMNLRLETMPDNPNRAAVFYGPVVLAGELGAEKDSIQRGSEYVPAFITGNKNITEWLIPVEHKSLTFATINTGKPRDIVFYPFYKMHNKRYSVYWDYLNEDQWNQVVIENKAEAEMQQKLINASIDFIQPGEKLSESDHNFQGDKTEPGEGMELKWREAYHGGWFSYDVKTYNEKSLSLVCTYWGGDSGKRNFDILIDGEVIATQSLQKTKPGKYFDVIYNIPAGLLNGKEKINIRFQAKPDNLAGAIYGVRIIDSKKK